MRPPQHSIDAEPILILPTDPAWDMDRIGKEVDENPDHAWVKYQRGEGRYDLLAPHGDDAAADYLLGEPEPLKFHLRRLTVMQLAEVQGIFRREFRAHGENGDYLMSWAKACSYGLADVSGPGSFDLEFSRGALTDASFQRVHDDLGGMAAVSKLGEAIFMISQPLTAAEKKR